MNQQYSFTVVGNPDDGFTSIEINGAEGNYVGRIFELEDGWYINLRDTNSLKDPTLVDAILEAQKELRHYVNRKGAKTQDASTIGNASLRLMQRDDGKGFSKKEAT